MLVYILIMVVGLHTIIGHNIIVIHSILFYFIACVGIAFICC